MTPPKAPTAGSAAAGDTPPAVSTCLQTPALTQPGVLAQTPVLAQPTVLTQRADFLRAARARHTRTSGMIVQARRRGANEDGDGIRVGFTCSKKVGNAVARNRAKRRLREVARLLLPTLGRDGWDYVLIGKAGVTGTRPFERMQDDLRAALAKLHKSAP